MTRRSIRLQVEELGARTLPSVSMLPAPSLSPTAHIASATVASPTRFAISAPAATVAGASFNITVTALDQSGNKVTGYTGTIHFSSSDGTAILPANARLTNGTGTFSVTVKKAGSQTISATDTAKATLSGISQPINVTPAAAAKFTVSAPATTVAGASFNFTVTALDQFGNKATGYTGTVHFSSSDGTAILPANARLTNGTGTFSATLKTTGSQTLSAADTAKATLSGTSGTVNVSTLGKLSGAGQGTFVFASVPYGHGPGYSFWGTVNLAGLGPISFSGSLSAPPSKGVGQPTGLLELSNGSGSLILELVGAPQSGASPSRLPTSIRR